MGSLWRMIRLSALAAFAPERFLEADLLDDQRRRQQPVDDELRKNMILEKRAQLESLRSGWASSLGLMAYAATVGLLFGRIALKELGDRPGAAMLVGVAGGVLLLWSAIALRGWEIQTNDGDTPVEQINSWIVRAACFVGTILAVISVSWDASF